MALYTYSRIREEPAAAADELVRSGEVDPGIPGGEAALQRLIDAIATDSVLDAPVDLARKETAGLRTAIAQWGAVKSIRFMQRVGASATRTHQIRTEYLPGQAQGQVAVQWGMYEVRQEHLTSVWRIAIDRAGEIWSVHAGVAP